MDYKAVIKAAIPGALILVALSFLELMPIFAIITFIASFVVYLMVGVLAAHWMKQSDVQSGAKNGGIAALASATIAIIVKGMIEVIYFAATGSSQVSQLLDNISPEQKAAISEILVNPGVLVEGFQYLGVIAVTLGFCGGWIAIALIFGAAGGAFWAGGEPDKQVESSVKQELSGQHS